MELQQVIREWSIFGGSRSLIQLFGGLTTRAALRQLLPTALVYGPSIAVDASAGNQFVVTVTDGVAFAFANPTFPPGTTFGQQITITIRNASGGALGAGTFGTAYKVSGNVAATTTGNSRTIAFVWNGTNWIEIFRTAADVAN